MELYKRNTGKKQLEVTNHLGNVMAVISDRKIPANPYYFTTGGSAYTFDAKTHQYYYVGSGGTHNRTTASDPQNLIDYYIADVDVYSDYYPFGQQMPSRNGGSTDYKFGFNDMEKITEVTNNPSHYDFGARIYDARIGRWNTRDPKEAKYPFASPYSYPANNPISFVDKDGEEGNHYIRVLLDDGIVITFHVVNDDYLEVNKTERTARFFGFLEPVIGTCDCPLGDSRYKQVAEDWNYVQTTIVDLRDGKMEITYENPSKTTKKSDNQTTYEMSVGVTISNIQKSKIPGGGDETKVIAKTILADIDISELQKLMGIAAGDVGIEKAGINGKTWTQAARGDVKSLDKIKKWGDDVAKKVKDVELKIEKLKEDAAKAKAGTGAALNTGAGSVAATKAEGDSSTVHVLKYNASGDLYDTGTLMNQKSVPGGNTDTIIQPKK